MCGGRNQDPQHDAGLAHARLAGVGEPMRGAADQVVEAARPSAVPAWPVDLDRDPPATSIPNPDHPG